MNTNKTTDTPQTNHFIRLVIVLIALFGFTAYTYEKINNYRSGLKDCLKQRTQIFGRTEKMLDKETLRIM